MAEIQDIQRRLQEMAGHKPVVPPIELATENSWFHKIFTREEVDSFKEIRAKKDQIIANQYGKNTAYGFWNPTAWTGKAGEAAFADLLSSVYGYVDGIHFTHWEKDDDTDDRDFTLSMTKKPLEIDVKTRTINVEPKAEYEGNLKSDQYEKVMRLDCPINTLVFADFILPKNEVVIFGWITVSEFDKLKVFRKAGSPAGKITVSHDMYCIQLSQLHPFRKVKTDD